MNSLCTCRMLQVVLMILAHPNQVPAQHPNVTPITVQLLDVEICMTPPPAKVYKLPSVMPESPSYNPEPSKKAIDQHIGPLQTTKHQGLA